ncbi:IS5 family transposase IS4811 [Paraburkholderia fynbosensis]|uniref:IS5 family transposase IS4811 n=2 Tax=Paraburkholderia fynbosensis TaxID=1200993 RepID=A0A6J5H2M4_9BURK|nr:IS5 family transposase IS4811 [Paraburkholderia fynbosensis]
MSGSCRLEATGYPSAQINAGDFLLMSAPPSWVLSKGETGEMFEFPALRHPTNLRMVSFGSGPGSTRIIGGHFCFDTVNANLLNGLLSPVVHIGNANGSASALRGIIELVDREASFARPGQTFVVNRLIEIMLVEAFRSRSAVDAAEPEKPGMLAGLADEQLAHALREIHADIARHWTVAAMAMTAGMSRSAFAERFTRVVGTPPGDYVLNWRMALAKDALRFTSRPLIEIASATGYGSASAFSTAFSRAVGCSPARYANRKKSRGDNG